MDVVGYRTCTQFDSGETRAQSLARDGHPSMWLPRLVVLDHGFQKQVLSLRLTYSLYLPKLVLCFNRPACSLAFTEACVLFQPTACSLVNDEGFFLSLCPFQLYFIP